MRIRFPFALSFVVLLALATPTWAYTVLTTGGDSPGVQEWFAGIDDLNKAEAYVPVELSPGDPSDAYLNVVIDLNNDSNYAPYIGSGGPQQEWVIVNEPISVPSGPGHYYSSYFDLTDISAKSGSHLMDVYVTSAPIGSVAPGTGTFTGPVAITNYQSEPPSPSTEGPSASPNGIFAASPTRALPSRQQQVGNECFITSVAMSMKWLESKYPGMFPAALPAIADLITAMKQTDEWKTHSIIRWGHLSEWKGTIFGQYKGKVLIHKWNGTDDAYTWMKGQIDDGEDVEMSMGYKPVANGDGHTVILTGWVEDGNKKWVTVVDPGEPNKNGKQLDKKIKVTGTDVDYPSRNGTVIREIDAESPDTALPAQPTTWGRLKNQYH